jgi:DNA-binding NarL/FixJ family response regulator
LKKNKITIFIADDHPTVLIGLTRHLADTGRYIIAGTATNGEQLINDTQLRNVDVLILDLNMPHIDGLKAIEILRNEGFNGKIIVNSSYSTRAIINDAISKGADGFLTKSSELAELIDTIEKVIVGDKVFPTNINLATEESSYFLHDNYSKKYKLTKREVEIIRFICNNTKTKDIALALNISEFTVSTHRKNIFFKLGIDSSVIELYEFAKNNSLI